MKTFTGLSLLLFLIIMVSCKENYASQLTSLSQKLTSEGKQILYQTKNVTQQDHEIIYIDGDKIMLNNIDSVSTILSGNSIVRIHDLTADFLSDGELTISEFDVEEKTLSEYLEKFKRMYTNSEIQYQCINGDYLIIGTENDELWKDLICIGRPSELYSGVGITDEFDDAGNIIITINGDLARFPDIDYDFPLLPDPMIFYRGSCPFTWALTVNKQGGIISKAEEITSYGIKIPVNELTKVDVNLKNMLSSKYLPLIERQMFLEEQQTEHTNY